MWYALQDVQDEVINAGGIFLLFYGDGMGEPTSTASSYQNGAVDYGFTRGYIIGRSPSYDNCEGSSCYIPYYVVIDTSSEEILAHNPAYSSIAGLVSGAAD